MYLLCLFQFLSKGSIVIFLKIYFGILQIDTYVLNYKISATYIIKFSIYRYSKFVSFRAIFCFTSLDYQLCWMTCATNLDWQGFTVQALVCRNVYVL